MVDAFGIARARPLAAARWYEFDVPRYETASPARTRKHSVAQAFVAPGLKSLRVTLTLAWCHPTKQALRSQGSAGQ